MVESRLERVPFLRNRDTLWIFSLVAFSTANRCTLRRKMLQNRDNDVTSPSPAGTGVDSPYAWLRLTAAVVLGTIGSVGMWSVPVALPAVQAEFAVARGSAALPFTLAMMGFAFGGVVTGRLSDRHGIVLPLAVGAAAISVGYVAAGFAGTLWLFALAYALIGFGTSATFGPMMADLSQWFTRRRGIAVAVVSSGNYIGGTIWPPVIEHFISSDGWRATHMGVGVFCILATLPLLLALQIGRAHV
jgi:MFS family permease